MTPSGITQGSSGFGFWFWSLFMYSATCLNGSSCLSVKVNDTSIFSCNGTCNGHLTWTYYTNNENLDVLRCEQAKCTEGNSFKNRVSPIQANIHPGILSLKLYPVLYNDEGWYMVKCDSVILCRFRLEVFVPTTMNSSVRSNVKLPCYARTEKQISDESVNILWKKDGQKVFQVQNGIPKNISGYTGRTSVSLKDYKDGDLSLTILDVTTSDTGLYQCYHKPSEEHGYPGAISLNIAVHEIFWSKKFGDDLTLNLFGSDVTVTFNESEAAVRHVCSVMGSNTTCSLDYVYRVSVKNDSLVLSGLTFSDKGTFIVKDKRGNVIAVNTVIVEGYRHSYVVLFVLAVFILFCVCLFLGCKCHKRSQKMTGKGLYCNVEESNVYLDLPREPACIRVSEQETSPYISESEDRPHTPVEETMPDTKMQENTVEEESTGQIHVVTIECPLNFHSLSVPINSPEKRLDI